jgi:hypothetical protein
VLCEHNARKLTAIDASSSRCTTASTVLEGQQWITLAAPYHVATARAHFNSCTSGSARPLDIMDLLLRTHASLLAKQQITAMNFINKISGALDNAADSARSAVLKLLEPEVQHRMHANVAPLRVLQSTCTPGTCNVCP